MRFLTTVVLFALGAMTVFAARPSTTLTGPLYSGATAIPATVRVWPSHPFTVKDTVTTDRYTVGAHVPWEFSVSNASNASLTLVPNYGSTNFPEYTSYHAMIITTLATTLATWQVPTSSPATIASITVIPSSNALTAGSGLGNSGTDVNPVFYVKYQAPFVITNDVLGLDTANVTLPASAITSGTFDAARIPALAYSTLTDVPTTFESKIVTGVGLAKNEAGEAYVDSAVISPTYANVVGTPHLEAGIAVFDASDTVAVSFTTPYADGVTNYAITVTEQVGLSAAVTPTFGIGVKYNTGFEIKNIEATSKSVNWMSLGY